MCRAVNSTLQRKLKVPCHVRSVSLLHERFSPQNVEDLMTFGDKVMFHAAKTTVRIMELRPEELDLSVDQVRYDPVVRGVFESYFLQVEEDLRRKVSTAAQCYTGCFLVTQVTPTTTTHLIQGQLLFPNVRETAILAAASWVLKIP